MITCPYCGTNYGEWRAKCKSCGGPLPKPPPPSETTARGMPIIQLPGLQINLGQGMAPVQFERPEPPPPAPRQISSSYAFRILFSSAWGIVGAIFTVIGLPFTCVGMTAVFAEPIFGIVFGGIGSVFFFIGIAVFVASLYRAFKTVDALRRGDTAEGQLTEVKQDYSTTINGNHPWIVKYRFGAVGRDYAGEVRTMNYVGMTHMPGMPVWVLYLRENPEYNSLFPHP